VCPPIIPATYLVMLYLSYGVSGIIVFKAKESTTHQMFNKAKLHSLRWLKLYNVNIDVNSDMWWLSHFVCLDIN
jgi:hypothetical protein